MPIPTFSVCKCKLLVAQYGCWTKCSCFNIMMCTCTVVYISLEKYSSIYMISVNVTFVRVWECILCKEKTRCVCALQIYLRNTYIITESMKWVGWEMLWLMCICLESEKKSNAMLQEERGITDFLKYTYIYIQTKWMAT